MNKNIRFLFSTLLLSVISGSAAYAMTIQSSIERVNLLELYTSHGCSSCPPADTWLKSLEEHPGLWQQLIPMAFHVDYWDKLGWPDRFASTAFSKRQYDYRRSGAVSSVYTPGFVLNGHEWRDWFKQRKLDLKPTRNVGQLTLQFDQGKNIQVHFAPEPHLNGVDLQANLGILGFGVSSHVGGGENRGRTLEESFVVLNYNQVTSTGAPNNWQFKWPEITATTTHKLAIVVWLNKTGSNEPVQAAGGWLP